MQLHHVYSKQIGEDIKIQALGFPTIFSLLPTPVNVNQYPHLRDLDLADESTHEDYCDMIDILIGSDCYWHVVIGNINLGKSGPVALNSYF